MDEDRRAKLERLRASRGRPVPVTPIPGVQPPALGARRARGLEAGEETDAAYRVAGRLTGRREIGKAAFLDVTDRSGKIQVQARKRRARR